MRTGRENVLYYNARGRGQVTQLTQDTHTLTYHKFYAWLYTGVNLLINRRFPGRVLFFQTKIKVYFSFEEKRWLSDPYLFLWKKKKISCFSFNIVFFLLKYVSWLETEKRKKENENFFIFLRFSLPSSVTVPSEQTLNESSSYDGGGKRNRLGRRRSSK